MYLYYLRRLCILGLVSHLIKSKAIVLNLTKFYTKLGYYNFIIYRGDSKPVFNFVNPIDDIDFKISHVIRGEDHIANLEKHTLFFKIFKQLNPQYIHVPLLLNPFNLNKLSKKNKMFSIKRFLERGILEESILNLLFLQGKNIFLNFLTIDQMINFFSLKKIGVKNSTVDIKKLYFLNKKHIQNITNNYYLFRIKNFLKKKKIFQLKSLRENNSLYLILKNNIKQLYIISNLFLNEFLTPKKCSFCFKMLILNTKLISVSKLEINRIDFKNKNFKFIRVFLTGVEVGLPVIVLLKFYNKMRLYNNKTRI
ncbi:hypothetical protein E5P55_01095 [Candidatus Pinguicoccus supinus]|uniref:Glutamyl/glutaminyl-tRNA synthetase class Ib catalytic domain-containing protein n=1 Tax=Candidatus Pinguicoccus supinus TaxID=2529394 RepID=A0A7T0BRJ1_9BACT|nr:hypothetical protein E5P55_01095 [Candidatus Pinguicoccus supinus]